MSSKKEKKMSAMKKNIIIVLVVVLIAIGVGVYAVISTSQGFDAKGYVQAMLDKTIKGETKAAVGLINGATEESLSAQYDEMMTTFVRNQMLAGVQVDAEMEKQYVELCKKIFASMKYEIQDAIEQEDGNFKVTVKYQSTDAFSNFITKAAEEKTRLEDLANKGEEYRGNREEIALKMQEDLIKNAYSLLEQCHNEATYSEEKTMVFTIVKEQERKYSMNSEEVTAFVQKIIGLDAKED